jgi:uncharacterized membrane protein
MTSLEATAAAPCGRCGTFAPQTPFWGRMLCADCVSREPALFSAPPTTSSILEGVRVLFGRVGREVLFINAVASLPGVLVELAGVEQRGLRFVEFMLDVAVGGVCTHLALQAAAQIKPASFSAACGAVGRHFAQLLGAAFLTGIIAIVFALFFLVPGVLRLLSYTLSTPIVLLENPGGSYEALKQSAERMTGHRGAAFGAYLVIMSVTFVLPFVIYMVAMFATMSDSLVEGQETLLERLLMASFMLVVSTLVGARHLVAAALYLKLAPPGVWPVADGRSS